MRIEVFARDGGSRHVDLLVAIEAPVALGDREGIMRMGERGDEQEGTLVVGAGDFIERALGGEGDFVVEIELVGAHAEAGLRHRTHIVIPVRPLRRMIPVRRPAVVGGIDVGRQALLEAVQLVGAAKMHLARQDRAIAEIAQVMRIGRNVGAKFGGIVIDAANARAGGRS